MSVHYFQQYSNRPAGLSTSFQTKVCQSGIYQSVQAGMADLSFSARVDMQSAAFGGRSSTLAAAKLRHQ